MKQINISELIKAEEKMRYAGSDEKVELSAKVDAIRAKIENELDAVQKRCTARTVDVDQVIDCVQDLYKKMTSVCTLAAMNGASFHLDPNHDTFPRAYKYKPMSTIISVCVKNGKWYIYSFGRFETQRKTVEIPVMTKEMKDSIIEHYMRFDM